MTTCQWDRWSFLSTELWIASAAGRIPVADQFFPSGISIIFVLVAHVGYTGAIRAVDFFGVGVQHISGALGRCRGKRRIRCRLAARCPVLAGACAEPAGLPVGIYGNLALLIRPIQGDAMLLQSSHCLLSRMLVRVAGSHTEKGISGRCHLQQFLSGGR